MKFLRVLIWTFLLCVTITPALAAVLNVECPVVVEQALTATDEFCDKTGRNQACYGHARLEAQPQTGAPAFSFAQAGDIVDVAAIQSLHLSPMELATGNWGVALLRLQANLPSSQSSDVTVLTFGDVQIQSAVKPATRVDVTAANTYVNVRLLPTVRAGVVGALAPNQATVAVERLADNSWLRVEVPGSDLLGWVSADLISAQDDINSLNTTEPRQPYYQPMQAFYFESHSDTAAACPEVPPSGLLIQTPEGVGEVKLLVNEVSIQMGSTVFFDAQPGGIMSVTTVEGHARVEALGVVHTAVAGTSIQVPLGADMKPSGPPSLPQPYDETALQSLPVKYLDRPIDIHPALSRDELAEVIAAEQAEICCADDSSSPDVATPCADCTDDGQPDCSGSNCDNDGSADDCSGSSCDSDNSSDECPGSSCDVGNKDKDKDKDKDCPGSSCDVGNKDKDKDKD